MKALERGSNYLQTHGAYMEDWRIHGTWVWETVLEVSTRMARSMLETAYMAQHLSEGGTKYLSELAQDPEINGFHWLNVGNKDIVVYHVDGEHVYALTNRDGRLYVIKGEYRTVLSFMEQQEARYPEQTYTKRFRTALTTLQYDLNCKDLATRCAL